MRLPYFGLIAVALIGCGDKDTDTGPELTDADGDGFTTDLDCDDGDAAINQAADELCDGIDNNCNEEIDEDPTDGGTYYADLDGDGYGNPDATETACDAAPSGYVDNSDDCNDGTNTVFPGGTELCDGLDNDCDGEIDDGAGNSLTFYADSDSDGYGNPKDTVEACAAPSGYVANGTDCDDADETVNPDTTWYSDYDYDNYGDPKSGVVSCEQPTGYVQNDLDCDDESSVINPDMKEICDGLDTNCDGKLDADDTDMDADGQAPCQGDCDDADKTVFAGGVEICDDFVDNNCDSRVDNNCPYDTSDVDVTIAGTTSSEYLGYRSSVGDINQDGYDDIAIGAYGNDVGDTNAGAVFVYLGPMTAGSYTTSDASYGIYGDEYYDYLGENVDIGSDVDGDGYTDMIVVGRGSSYEGFAYLFYGPISSDTYNSEADGYVMGSDSYDYLGRYHVSTDDLDGDGDDDIIVGNYYWYDDDTGYYTGAISVFDTLDEDELESDGGFATMVGDTSYGYVGYSADGSADFDGDGNNDLAYGQPNADAAYIVNGPVSGVYGPNDSDHTFEDSDTTVNAYFGSDVTSGDYNGDGYDDLFIAGYYFASSTGSYGAGAHKLFYGPFTGDYDATDASYSVEGGAQYDYVGAPYYGSDAGDVDGDGYEDFIFGVAYQDTGSTYSTGASYLNYGPFTGSQTTATYDRGVLGATSYGYMGYGTNKIGDLDGDGAGDMVTGTYTASSYAGNVYILFNAKL